MIHIAAAKNMNHRDTETQRRTKREYGGKVRSVEGRKEKKVFRTY